MAEHGIPIGCLFGAGRHGRLNKEHVWPAWVKECLAETVGSFHVQPGVTGAEPSVWELATFNQEAFVVCERCNGGWMSHLEGQVKSWLCPVIRDQHAPLALSPEQREVVATWAVKQALVLQAAFSVEFPPCYLPPGQLAWLPARHTPPPGARVWVFQRLPVALAGQYHAAFSKCLGVKRDAEHPGGAGLEEPVAYVATFAIGWLGFLVFGPDHPFRDEPSLLSVQPPSQVREALAPIWPSLDPIGWPKRLLGPILLDLLGRTSWL